MLVVSAMDGPQAASERDRLTSAGWNVCDLDSAKAYEWRSFIEAFGEAVFGGPYDEPSEQWAARKPNWDAFNEVVSGMLSDRAAVGTAAFWRNADAMVAHDFNLFLSAVQVFSDIQDALQSIAVGESARIPEFRVIIIWPSPGAAGFAAAHRD